MALRRADIEEAGRKKQAHRSLGASSLGEVWATFEEGMGRSLSYSDS